MKNLNKKKLILVGICLIVLLIVLVLIFVNKGSSDSDSEESESEPSLHLYTHQVIDIENLDTSLYKDSMKQIKNFKIASKYNVGKKATAIDAYVDMYLDDNMAKPIYIREDNNKLNIVQLKYEINSNNEENTPGIQVEEMMRDFEMACKSNMGLMDLEKEPNEVSISNEKTPYSESVYKNKELYSARYIVEDEHFTEEDLEEMQIDKSEYTKTYDINFYMDGDNTLICEFVRILK